MLRAWKAIEFLWAQQNFLDFYPLEFYLLRSFITARLNNTMSEYNIEIVYRPITKLIPAVYNPRKHTKPQAQQLKESITRFGFCDPVICNSALGRENIIIGGHFRCEIAKELGMIEVPVVYVAIPDIEKEKELNIRLNKNTGEFDIEKLETLNLDLLLEVGFDKDELADLWSEHLQVEENDFDETKELAAIKTPTTQLGDLIILGSHRLLCGDATDPASFDRLFGEERASMIYSDPVYNIKLSYNTGVGGKQQYGGNVNDNRTDIEYYDFIKKSLECALAVTAADAHIFYWSDQTYIWLIQQLYRELGITNKRVCLWLKNGQNPTPGVAFNKCYEPCTYGVRGKPYIAKNLQNLNEVMNKEMTTGNNLLEEALDHLDIWTTKRLSGKDYEHATSKPPQLHEKAIRRCTRPGDIILDSFLGSGSTLIAAEKLRRRVFATELEPIFCDLTIRRFEKLTGTKARVVHDHETL
jgi:DNA modification methylase